jgi:putative flippase GtrA
MGDRFSLSGMLPRAFRDQRLRFLFVGGVNTAFSYFVFLLLYLLLGRYVHYLVILAVSHFISVSGAYWGYRCIVFSASAQGGWREYLRFNAVYLGFLVLNAIAMFAMVELLHMNVLLVQGILVLTNTIIGYITHQTFTFKKK